MRNKTTRITLDMNIKDVIIAMCDGNPGALNVMMGLVNEGDKIDPEAGFGGGFHALLNLDSNGIYGSRIWMLYKDVCDQDLATTVGLLRAVQLGLLSSEALDTAIDDYGAGLNIGDLMGAVRAKLKEFQS